mgnify:CR=1 FL=1
MEYNSIRTIKNIYFFLYDKEKIIENPMVFKKCYEEKIKENGYKIIVSEFKRWEAKTH